MANQGVFTRELNQLGQIPRSLQNLSHRSTHTLRTGVIIPNFTEILNPNETLHLRTTNYLRTIPLKTPMLSRVRVFQRFVAVPMRIMWYPWEDYINAPNPAAVTPVEPYICNFNFVGEDTLYHDSVTGVRFPQFLPSKVTNFAQYSQLSSTVSRMRAVDANYNDFSSLGYETVDSDGRFDGKTCGFSRRLCYVTGDMDTETSGYQFFPHELGDYLNVPLFSVGMGNDTSTRFSAFKFCAYQMAYSFFYRKPNIEERIDDIYEQGRLFGNDIVREATPYCSFYDWKSNDFTPPISYFLGLSSAIRAEGRHGRNYELNSSGGLAYASSDWASDSDKTHVDLTSWRNVERFPLRSGANFTMQATVSDALGMPNYFNSRISLTRLRYAPWLMDRFTSANPWPQRNDEALIPVSGSINVTLPNSTQVSFSGLSVDVPASELGTYDQATGNIGRLYISGAGNNAVIAQGANLLGTGGYLADVDHDVQANAVGNIGLVSRAVQGTVSGSASASFSSSSANVEYALSVSPSNFRFYMQLQHIKEKSGFTDGRYKSYMSMFFGSRLSNNQIDYPQFIGGFVQDLNISEIAQTSASDTTPLGTLAGRGVSAKKSSLIKFHAVEHTVVLGLLHILPDAEYIGGLNRVDHTTNPFDWTIPDFAGISEQPIRNSEVSMISSSFTFSSSASHNDAAFGYEPRFNELRARHSYVTGAFRDSLNMTGSREYYKPWIVTRDFGFDSSVTIHTKGLVTGVKLNVPTLSKEFISTRGTVDASNFSVTNEQVMPPYMLDSFFDESIARIVPSRGIPRI